LIAVEDSRIGHTQGMVGLSEKEGSPNTEPPSGEISTLVNGVYA